MTFIRYVWLIIFFMPFLLLSMLLIQNLILPKDGQMSLNTACVSITDDNPPNSFPNVWQKLMIAWSAIMITLIHEFWNKRDFIIIAKNAQKEYT